MQPRRGRPSISFRVLGGFGIDRDGADVDLRRFGGRLAVTLTKVLVTRCGHVAPREVLCDALWPGTAPVDPGANLNALVHRARRALAVDDLVRTTPSGYLLDAQRCVVDADLFRSGVAAGRAELAGGRAGSALRILEQALAQWTGEPLPDDAWADWAGPYRDGLVEEHQRARELAAEAALLLPDPGRAVDLAERAARDAPLHEPAQRLLARARAAGGDRAGALAVLDRLRARLADELGVDTSAQTDDLRLRLLRDDVPVAVPSEPRAPRRSELALPFVGRQEELARLVALARRPRGGVALVAGQAGTGKSRLLEELTACAGSPAVAARAYAPERDTPWALARTLLSQAARRVDVSTVVPARPRRALADLVPDLAVPGQADEGPLEAQTRRALAVEGGLRLLTAATSAGGLVVVDDLQWADASSLQLLALAAERLDGVTIALAYRPEDVGASSDAAALLAGLKQTAGVVAVALGRLPAAAIGQLVADDALVRVLATETDGTPFAVAEALAALDEEGLTCRGVAGAWRVGSDRAVDRARELARRGRRRATAARIARLSGPARDVLTSLALLGREAPAGLLAAATGRPAQAVLEDIEALDRADLVRVGRRGWAPAHDLIADAVADGLTQAQRIQRHTALAGALRTQPSAPGELAHHLLRAGDAPAAAQALARDARRQLARRADREAARLASSALALGPPDAVRSDLLDVRAEAVARGGDLDAAREDLRAALSLTDLPVRRAVLLARLAMLTAGAEDLAHAAELAELAVLEAGDDPAAGARALAVCSIVDMNLGRTSSASTRSDRALALYRAIGDSRGVADVLDGQAMAVFLAGRLRDGVARFARVARLHTDLGDLLRVVTPRSTRGHGLVFAGEPEQGLAETDAALELTRDLGSPEAETYVRWHRSEALSACDRVDEAHADATRALEIAQRLGHRGWTATAHRARGVAHEREGELRAAERAFRRSLDAAGDLPLFACWGHARLALVLVEQGRLPEAQQHVTSALGRGPELGQYEARLAHARLAAARGDGDAAAVARDAAQRAMRGGHETSARALVRLA